MLNKDTFAQTPVFCWDWWGPDYWIFGAPLQLGCEDVARPFGLKALKCSCDGFHLLVLLGQLLSDLTSMRSPVLAPNTPQKRNQLLCLDDFRSVRWQTDYEAMYKQGIGNSPAAIWPWLQGLSGSGSVYGSAAGRPRSKRWRSHKFPAKHTPEPSWRSHIFLPNSCWITATWGTAWQCRKTDVKFPINSPESVRPEEHTRAGWASQRERLFLSGTGEQCTVHLTVIFRHLFFGRYTYIHTVFWSTSPVLACASSLTGHHRSQSAAINPTRPP